MAYATVEDVEARLGRELTPDEADQVGILLEDAEAIIKMRVPNLDELVDDGTIPERIVVMIEVQMVLRVLRNPDAFISETDGNYSYTRSSSGASGYLEVLPLEWDWLMRGRGQYQLVPIPPYADMAEGYRRQPDAHDWAGNAEWWVVRVP